MRPCHEDIEFIEGIVRGWTIARRIDPVRALLLGVTPDIATMQWPATTNLVAVDNSFPMAKRVWPGDVPGRRSVVCADWRSPPFRKASFHFAVGDGSLNCLSYPRDFGVVAESLSALLCENGLLVLRSYLQSTPAECPDQLFRQALDGAVPSFHEFKLRLMMALQSGISEGVAVRDVYQWVRSKAGPADLSRGTGWPEAAVDALRHYNESSTVYAFPTIDQLRSALTERFEEVLMSAPRRGMGQRCPIIVFRRRPDRVVR